MQHNILLDHLYYHIYVVLHLIYFEIVNYERIYK